MKKFLLLTTAMLFVFYVQAQLLKTIPGFLTESSANSSIILDATQGNQALLNYAGDIFVHIGVITNYSTSPSDWKYVNSVWGSTDSKYQCSSSGSNKWEYDINTDLRTFFGIADPNEHIQKIAVLFRSADGNTVERNADGSDMYIPVYDNNVYVRFDIPVWQPKYNPTYDLNNIQLNDTLHVVANASTATDLKIFYNQKSIASYSAKDSIAADIITDSIGTNTVTAVAYVNGDSVNASTFNFVVPDASPVHDLPSGVQEGINYYPGNPTKATLVLYAPDRSSVYVHGDFNNWTTSASQYLMNKTSDGNYYWITLTGLTPGYEYAYEYIIDNSLIVADYNTEKVLDKNNDPYIDAATYPDLKPFPIQAEGNIVSVLQTQKPQYDWQVTNFQKPAQQNLRVYELWLGNFVQTHNWQTLQDTLSYLQNLGINAVEVMPFNEFEGNISWGYNPDFYFAPDKYYGTEASLKSFIDACHRKGIAVIMDMVLNHSFGSSPMVQMYWDNTNNRPAANSPWFNQVAKHAYNVGYDFNHDSPATRTFVDRVMKFWLDEYKIDGFRFDLAKGFTQTQTCDDNGGNCDEGALFNYDQDRVNIWNYYYSQLRSYSADAYCILEFLGGNDEETTYSNEGIMLWENMNAQFNQLTMGYKDNSDLDPAIYTNRNWTQNNMMLYMESHDEERLMYKNIAYGNADGSYNVKDTATALDRNGMAAALWACTPGPKMLWQFGELGYDYSIGYCSDGSISDGCRVDPKPIRWDYLQNPDRINLMNVYKKMFQLRNAYPATFNPNHTTTGTYLGQNDQNIRTYVAASDSLDLVMIGNFDVASQTYTFPWPVSGNWHTYLHGSGSENITSFDVTENTAASDSFNVRSADTTVILAPGEYFVFIKSNYNSSLPVNFLNTKAIRNGNTALISWQTANELNLKSYIIQRSEDRNHYQDIGSVTPDNKAGTCSYNFTDIQAFANHAYYYRIKQLSLDGTSSYSPVAVLSGINTDDAVLIGPNPSNGLFNIFFKNNNGTYPFSVYSVSGKMIMTGYLSVNMQQINLSNQPSGIYILTTMINNKPHSYKLIKK